MPSKAPSFEQVLARLRKDQCTASEIVDFLCHLRDPRFEPHISKALTTKFGDDSKVTRVLIQAAGRSRNRFLQDLLAKQLLEDPNSEFRFELLDALGKTGRSDFTTVLLRFLGRQCDEPTRSTAVFSLGLLGTTFAIGPLLQLVTHETGRIRELAVEALNRITARSLPRAISLTRGRKPRLGRKPSTAKEAAIKRAPINILDEYVAELQPSVRKKIRVMLRNGGRP
jgi:HEAT repeat protein